MFIRSRAPLRIGLAGGGTDVRPYSDEFGGAVLNATVNLYAHTVLEPTDDETIHLNAIDQQQKETLKSQTYLEPTGPLALLKGVYNRIIKDFCHEKLSFRLSTYVDVPPGSGLGSSSTLVVAILTAFSEWLKLPLGEYEIAQLSYRIERQDLKLTGGKQDQYAATFGGINFMEFLGNNVIVNPLRIKSDHLHELEETLVLYYLGKSRLSSQIIDQQTQNVRNKNTISIDAMHHIKDQAVKMKEALLKGNLDRMGEILDYGWHHKKQMATGISNLDIDKLYEAAINAGALGGKISGAGGGGFMMFYCPLYARYKVIETLSSYNGYIQPFQFVKAGVTSWQMDKGKTKC